MTDPAWTMGENVTRDHVPAPPATNHDPAWAACADAMPVWLLPPDPWANRRGGWAAMLATPAGRNCYANAWQSLPVGTAVPAQTEAPTGRSWGLGRARPARATMIPTMWQANAGKGLLRFVFGLIAVLGVSLIGQGRGVGPGLTAVQLIGLLIALPGVYLYRHVPTRSYPPKCDSCGRVWQGERLCTRCTRVIRDTVGIKAVRRRLRSL